MLSPIANYIADLIFTGLIAFLAGGTTAGFILFFLRGMDPTVPTTSLETAYIVIFVICWSGWFWWLRSEA